MKVNADWLRNHESQKLLAEFSNSGFEAYFVGGCVRNALLNAPVADLDVSTNALPQQTIALAEHAGFQAIPTGIEHGTITVIVENTVFEVTSFRKDIETRGRRAVVAFSTDIRDDALRRDFTMNALYASADGKVVDPLNGFADLKARRVRFIEDPEQRIKEDYLRILRYFRFFAWYADQRAGLDAEALAAISNNLDGLDILSKERIGAEMRKLLAAPDPVQAVAGMEQSGVLSAILPGATARFLGPLVHLETAASLPPDWMRRLIVLGGQQEKEALRLSKAEVKRLTHFQTASDAHMKTAEVAYRFDESIAWDIELAKSAALGTDVSLDAAQAIRTGTTAKFPITASDLQPDFIGIELGKELRRLETDWVRSGFSKSKSELLKLG